MKKFAFAITAVLFACIAMSAQPAPDATKAIVKSYLEIQAHLAADNFPDVKGPARTMKTQAVALGKPGEPIAKAAAAVETATDVSGARDAFGPLSDAVIALVQADGSRDAAADLRLAYCPMAKRSWLQREEQVRNPYYGSKMSSCGEFKPLKK
jgi:Protein of unknown function (DUF3347)